MTGLNVSAVYYDRELVKLLKESLFSPYPPFFCERPFFSEWRVLHVDGFERYWMKSLPVRIGEPLKFFDYPAFDEYSGEEYWES